MFNVVGPGDPLGTRLVRLPPASSSLATRVSAPRLDPVNTPRTVSKLLPIVSMNEVGDVRLNEQGAVHVHHALGVDPEFERRSFGSPASDVNPAFDPVVVTALPVSVKRLAKLSFVTAMPVAANAIGLFSKIDPDASLAVAVSVLPPAPSVQPPIVATPDAFVTCVAPVTLPAPAVIANVTVTPARGLPSSSVTSTDGAGDAAVPAVPVRVVDELGEIFGMTSESRNATMSPISPGDNVMPPMATPAGDALKNDELKKLTASV